MFFVRFVVEVRVPEEGGQGCCECGELAFVREWERGVGKSLSL